MAIQITITDAGRAEIVNAQNTGTAPVLISEIGIGTGQYTPAPTQTALQAEIKRLNTLSGQVTAADTIHVTASDESADNYSVYEFGLYTDNGTLFAVYSQTGSEIVNKTTDSAILLAVDIIFATIDAAALTFGNANFTNPDATLETKGIATLANEHKIPLLAAATLNFGKRYHLASNDTFKLPLLSTLTGGDSVILTKSIYNQPRIEFDNADITAGKKFIVKNSAGEIQQWDYIGFDVGTELTLVYNSAQVEIIL